MKKYITNLLVKYLIKKSIVISNKKIGEDFQLLTIKLAQKKSWTAGQKIQIKVSKTELRSYTPSSWSADNRTFQTLIYNHRSGPGALWSESIAPQTSVQVVGPRKSLELSGNNDNLIFFGDETTFGLACILKKTLKKSSIKCFFEATRYSDSLLALQSLQLEESVLIERTRSDTHLKICLDKIMDIYSNETIIISGKKNSIEFLERSLLERNIPPEKIIKKRYWGWKKPELAI